MNTNYSQRQRKCLTMHIYTMTKEKLKKTNTEWTTKL